MIILISNQRRGNCGRCPSPIRPNALDGDAGIPLAMAYVKNAHFGQIFDPGKALSVGTVFPELYKPFRAVRCSAQYSGRSYR